MGSILKNVSCFIYRFNSDLSELHLQLVATGQGGTYAAQLTSLQSAYNGLTTEQKLRSVLVINDDGMYFNTRVPYGRYVKTQLNVSLKAQYVEGMYIDTAQAIKVDNVNGTVTSSDFSTSTVSKIELWA